jgi:hypothetical protein
VTSRHDETARLAQDMPHKALTVTQDDTCTGGLCRVTMDPESHGILVAQLAQARDQASWHALRSPVLAQRHGRVIQATSEEAPGLFASVEQYLEAHHSPDLCHGQHELVKAVAGPMATKERAAHKAVTAAREQLERRQTDPQSAGDEPAKRRPGPFPKHPVRLEHAEPALAAARREPARLAQHRAQVKASMRGLGHDDHVVDLERGVRRNGQRIAADIPGHIEQMRTLAQHAGLSQRCLERSEKAERVVPKMPATSECGSRDGRQQVAQRDGTPPASCAMHAQLLPSYALERVAETRTRSDGEPLRELAERLRAPLFEAGGVWSAWRPEAQAQLHAEAKRLAAVCQRSSANVEGRNGSLSLRNHPLRGRDLPRTRACFTTLHTFCLTRPDGTTAAERFFCQKPHAMFMAILASVELAPAPLSPPRKA